MRFLPPSIDRGFAGRAGDLFATVDGAGTKTVIARRVGGGAHAQIGRDIVHHCANDLLASWAKPILFVDSIAFASFDADVFSGVVQGIDEACAWHGCAFVSGETAVMDTICPDAYDVVGCMVGTPIPHVHGRRDPRAGDILIGLPSDGLHTNGFTLARRVLGNTDLTTFLPGTVGTIGDALMRPHRHYDTDLFPLTTKGLVCAMAHITGGGIAGNVARVIPDGLDAVIDHAMPVPPIMTYLIERGAIPPDVAEAEFNMGTGFVVIAAPENTSEILGSIPGANVIGHVSDRRRRT